MVVRAGWQEHAVVRLCSDVGETGIGWLGERHGETVVPRSPQDIIGRKDGCDERNSAKALMRTEKSTYRMMARSGQVRSAQGSQTSRARKMMEARQDTVAS